MTRAGKGTVVVQIGLPDGRKRVPFFVAGPAFRARVGQADTPPQSKTSKQADLSFVAVGSERHESPGAVVLGG